MKKILFLILFLIIVGGVWIYALQKDKTVVVSFADCVQHGYEVMESSPRQCHTPNGVTFTETAVPSPTPDISPTPLPTSTGDENISVSAPEINGEVTSPLKVTGQARGAWFFEANFPVKLLDGTGKVLAQVPAWAKGESMRQDFVPFEATLIFKNPTTATGTLVLKKDNPSGLPENAAEARIPVRFSIQSSNEQTQTKTAGCTVTGCNGELCVSEEQAAIMGITSCIYKPEYACYKNATCARQANGQCGWTKNPQLTACLNRAKSNPGSQQLMPQ